MSDTKYSAKIYVPIDDETIERLAKVAYDTYYAPIVKDALTGWNGEFIHESVRGTWRSAIRAVLAELTGEGK